MKYITIIAVSLLACLITGCVDSDPGPTYDDITSGMKMPPELQGCKIYDLDGKHYMRVMTCPDKNVVNEQYHLGKAINDIAVIQGVQTFPLGSKPVPAATSTVATPSAGEQSVDVISALSKEYPHISQLQCYADDCKIVLTK